MNEIINTLVIKDIKSRFYGDRLAYAWSLINPLAWIGALIIFFSLIGKQVPIYTDIISFLIPGMLAYILFRNTINSIMRTRKTTQAIIHFPSVTAISVITAAGLIELINCSVVFLVLIFLNYIIFDKIECNDLLVMIYGYFCAWGAGLAFGCFFMELSIINPIFDKILPILLRPIFWISGVFYTANELPERLSELSIMNPLFQSIEIIRDGTFLSYQSRTAMYFQPLLIMAGVLGIGALLHFNQKKLKL
jgi:capsular polysaccharide transport system permease protein